MAVMASRRCVDVDFFSRSPYLLNEGLAPGVGLVELVFPGLLLRVVLVVLFGRVKRCVPPDLCGNGFFKLPGIVEFLLRGHSNPFLLLIVVEDGSPVLGSLVRELALLVGRIDLRPEDVEELLRTRPFPGCR